MKNPIVTKEFVGRLSENIGAKFGVEVSYIDALDLVASSLRCEIDPLMLTLELGGELVNERPNGRIDDYELTFDALHPSIDQLESLPFDTAKQLLKFAEEQRSGLVLVTGNSGTGKSVLAGSLLKGWVAEHGGIGVVFQREKEFESLNGAAGSNGQLVFQQSRGGNSDVSEVARFGRRYVLMGDPLKTQSHFINAINLAETRLVIATCSPVHFARMMYGHPMPAVEMDTAHPIEAVKYRLAAALHYEITTERNGDEFTTVTTRWWNGEPSTTPELKRITD
ncbi:hypothetical protein HFN89_01045 [Rhizobium laguerreae]|nr:hypothetical protein [Rhizobium laguerreae]